MMRFATAVLAVVIIAAASVCTGAVPQSISYQGVLRDSGGEVVSDGDYDLTFAIYDVASGGTELWSETQSLPVSGGIFNAALGVNSTLDLAFDVPYWLGIAVGMDPELTPRTELTAAPYAYRAAVADVGSDSDWEISGDAVYRLTGEVGIGTDTPAVELDVVGDASVSGALMRAGNAVWDEGNDGSASGLDADLLDGLDSTELAPVSHDHDDLYYQESELNDAGTINNPSNPMDWTKLKNVPAGFSDGVDNVGGSGDGHSLDADDGSPVDVVYVDATGEVGIGTVFPQRNLHIYEDVNNGVGIQIENPNTGDLSSEYLIFSDENGGVAGIIANDEGSLNGADLSLYNSRPGGDLSFSTGGLARGRFTSSGSLVVNNGLRVGGTSLPAESLSVTGTAEMDGFRLTASPSDGYVLTSDAAGNGTWQAASAGDVTGVTAGEGLSGGGGAGDVTLDVETGTGLEVSGDAVQLTAAYTDGSVHDGRFVNEGQSNSVTTGMIVPEVISRLDGVANDGGNIDLVAGANIAITPNDATNTITIAASAADDGDWTVSGSNVYRIPGNVGIGTSAPSKKLSVFGDGYVSGWLGVGTSNPVRTLHVQEDGLCYAQLTNNATGQTTGDGLLVGLDTSTGAHIINLENDELTFGTGGMTRVTIDASGNVGVGSLSPSKELSVIGDGYFSGNLGLGTTSTPQRLSVNGNGYIAGDLGVGTSTPSADLDVAGTAEVQGFRMQTGATSGELFTTDASGNASWQIVPAPSTIDGVASNGGNINFVAGSNMTITPSDAANTITFSASAPADGDWTIAGSDMYSSLSGEVGIGTSAPAAKLDVEAPGSLGSVVAIDRTSAPGSNYTHLSMTTPAGTSNDANFIHCRNAGVTQFQVKGDGTVYAKNGADFDGTSEIGYCNMDGVLTVDNSEPWAGVFKSSRNMSGVQVVRAEYTGTVSTDAIAVVGESTPADYYGVGGEFKGGHYGVKGRTFPTGSYTYYGVEGYAQGGSGTLYGVRGYASGGGTNYGVYGYAGGGSTNYAGYFNGNVRVNGTLSKSAGSFSIDHPLDPARKLLNHSFVESPDMMNVYNGNVVLDSSGEAWVEMPEWFETLNRDFRYQLTAVGAPGPNLYVASKMADSRFRIAGGNPGAEVSWQVTGIRQDPYAEANRIPVEEDKPAELVGKYLHPELYGQPRAMAMDYSEDAETVNE